MKRAVLFCAALLLGATGTSAETYRLGSLEIANPWSRATPKGAAVGAGYVSIRNTGTASDRLIGGSAEVGKRFEIHAMEMDQGVMKMREVKGGLEIKPGETIDLKPGGLHLMFVDLARPLQQGERVKGTLAFEKAGKVQVEFQVQGIGAAGAHQQGSAPPRH